MADCSDTELVNLREKVHLLEIAVARLQEQQKAAASALVIANKALEHSQQASNEWRQENIDQRDLYPQKLDVNGRFNTEAAERRSLEGRISKIELSLGEETGKQSGFDSVWLKGAVVITMLMTAISLIYKFVTGR